MSADLIEELLLLVSKQQQELASLNSKVETLEHQLFYSEKPLWSSI